MNFTNTKIIYYKNIPCLILNYKKENGVHRPMAEILYKSFKLFIIIYNLEYIYECTSYKSWEEFISE